MRKLANEELERKSIDEFKKSNKLPVCVLLDNVRSLNNVGSAFRTSDAFLIEKIYLGGITGTPPHREIAKTALGATESVEWEHVADPMACVKALKEKGYTIVSIEQVDQSVMLSDFKIDPDKKYCLIFGNEVFGVEDQIIHESDLCVEIPQHGTKHSLNISVSIGIVLWDCYNQLKNCV